MKRARAHVTKSKALITKKNISFNNKPKKLNDSIDNIKINKNLKNALVNEILPNKRNNSARKSSSSLSNKKTRSRDKSAESIKKVLKNDKFKNKILNKSNNLINKKLTLNKKENKQNLQNIKNENENLNKHKKRKSKEEIDIFEEEKEQEEDEESIKSFSEVRLEYLPCRKEEQDIIYNYIKKGLQTNGNYNSLYIAGMPGTGKTASVKTIINILESELKDSKNKKNKDIIPFRKLFISGIEFPNISNVFKVIYNFIFTKQKQFTVNKYIQLLDTFFSERKKYNSNNSLNDPSNSHIVLIIDEIDILINYTQNLLYNIFNWTTYEYSKLIVISISNTLDLPNRLLPKIRSRMGNNKIMFKPYNKEELRIIIKDRGIDLQLFSEDAIRLSCVKVAAINGDLRRIFQILTRAKQINEFENYKKKDKDKILVSKYDIINAWNELFSSKISSVIKSLQIFEKIIIASMLSKIKDNNSNKIKIGDLYDKKDIFLQKYNESSEIDLTITWEEFKSVIYNLMRIKLLCYYEMPKNNFIDNYVVIKFYTDEFILACEEDTEFKPVMDYLTQLVQ
jgi:Cdc6-like AAA superfamily ATPase